MQRNKYVKLLRDAKVKYKSQLDTESFSDNKKFSKAVKPIFSVKVNYRKANFLVENDETITGDAKIADIFNEYFVNIVKEIASSNNQAFLSDTNGIGNRIVKAIEKYKYHPSRMHIKQHNVVREKFNFRETSIDEVVHQLIILNTGKAAPIDSTPAKILKSNSFICAPLLHRILNENVTQNSFPDKLKEATSWPYIRKPMHN